MGKRVNTRVTRWQLAIAISLALHLGLAAVLSRSQWRATEAELASAPIITWLSDWKPPPAVVDDTVARSPAITAAVENIEAIEAVEAVEAQDAVAESDETLPDQQSEAPQPPPSLSQAPNIQVRSSADWDASLGRAIESLRAGAERANSYVTFGFPAGAEGDPDWRYSDSRDESARSIDERDLPPEFSSFGERIVALGNGCYMIAGSASIVVEDSFRNSTYYAKPRRQCPPPARVEDELFAEQKPDYLP